MHHTRRQCAATALAALAGSAAAQSDPAGFGTVYNIGTVPPGSLFDVLGAVTGTQAGDGNNDTGEAFITPMFLGGDTVASDSQLNLFDDGQIVGRFSAGPTNGSGSNIEFNIFGGSVRDVFFAYSGSTVNISSGTIGNGLDVYSGTVTMSAGAIGDDFFAGPGTSINLFGTSFILDGVELTDLVLGQAFTIADRDVVRTGVLADGSLFDFNLSTDISLRDDFFSPDATLTVTLVPAPGAAGTLAIGTLLAARRRRG